MDQLTSTATKALLTAGRTMWLLEDLEGALDDRELDDGRRALQEIRHQCARLIRRTQ